MVDNTRRSAVTQRSNRASGFDTNTFSNPDKYFQKKEFKLPESFDIKAVKRKPNQTHCNLCEA